MKKLFSKIEFSKLLTILVIVITMCIGIWSIIDYYSLAKLAIEANSDILPDSDLPIACITTILGSILSYCLYQGALKLSLNKNKLMVDKVTGAVKAIQENDFLEALEISYPEQTPVDCEYKE